MEPNPQSTTIEQEELEKFLDSLTSYKPTIPDSLIRHYLSRSGFQTDDVRLERLIALATQKFIADIAGEAIGRSRLRQQAPSSKKGKDNKVVLTMDDLERSLREYGVVLKKPPYFADSITAGATGTDGDKSKPPSGVPAQRPKT